MLYGCSVLTINAVSHYQAAICGSGSGSVGIFDSSARLVAGGVDLKCSMSADGLSATFVALGSDPNFFVSSSLGAASPSGPTYFLSQGQSQGGLEISQGKISQNTFTSRVTLVGSRARVGQNPPALGDTTCASLQGMLDRSQLLSAVNSMRGGWHLDSCSSLGSISSGCLQRFSVQGVAKVALALPLFLVLGILS